MHCAWLTGMSGVIFLSESARYRTALSRQQQRLVQEWGLHKGLWLVYWYEWQSLPLPSSGLAKFGPGGTFLSSTTGAGGCTAHRALCTDMSGVTALCQIRDNAFTAAAAVSLRRDLGSR
jgi:hypothetical protein